MIHHEGVQKGLRVVVLKEVKANLEVSTVKVVLEAIASLEVSIVMVILEAMANQEASTVKAVLEAMANPEVSTATMVNNSMGPLVEVKVALVVSKANSTNVRPTHNEEIKVKDVNDIYKVGDGTEDMTIIATI